MGAWGWQWALVCGDAGGSQWDHGSPLHIGEQWGAGCQFPCPLHPIPDPVLVAVPPRVCGDGVFIDEKPKQKKPKGIDTNKNNKKKRKASCCGGVKFFERIAGLRAQGRGHGERM